MSLKAALSCSALLHMGLLALRPPAGWVPPKEVLHDLVVTYLPVKATPRQSSPPPAPRVTPSPAARQKEVTPALRREFEESLPPVAPGERPLPPPGAGPPRAEPCPQVEDRARTAERVPEISPIPAASLPEGVFASVQHKHQVKEHLRTHLRYPSPRSQGWVRLQVWLDPSGALRQLRVLENSNPALAQRALEDARAAIPYPSFPRSLRNHQARYEFVVRYEPE